MPTRSSDSTQDTHSLADEVEDLVARVNEAEVAEYRRIVALHLATAGDGTARAAGNASIPKSRPKRSANSVAAKEYARIRSARSYRLVSSVLRGIKHPGRATLMAPFAAWHAVTQGAQETARLRAEYERRLTELGAADQQAALARLCSGAAYRIARRLSPRLARRDPRQNAGSRSARRHAAPAR